MALLAFLSCRSLVALLEAGSNSKEQIKNRGLQHVAGIHLKPGYNKVKIWLSIKPNKAKGANNNKMNNAAAEEFSK